MDGTALVLGGGGLTGAAWEVGLLAGLAEQGIDLAGADLVIGTSAGAVVGAQITSGASLAGLYRAQLAPPGDGPACRMGWRTVAAWVKAMAGARDDPAAARARLGRMALAAKTISESDRLAMIEARLPAREWPARRLVVTAVDAQSGEFATFTSGAGVSLVRAVAASTAAPGVWPPITAAGRRWIDGGLRSPANADLARGCGRVVVVAPLARGPSGADVASEVDALTAGGARAVAITPGRAASGYFGRRGLDAALCAPAALAGYGQAPEAAARIGPVWPAPGLPAPGGDASRRPGCGYAE